MAAMQTEPDDTVPDPAPDAAAPQPYEGDPQRLASRAKHSATWPVVVALLIIAGGVAFYFRPQRAIPPPPPVAVPAPQTAPAPETATTAAAPEVMHPIETEAAKDDTPLPSLEDSDAGVLNALAGLAGGDGLARILQQDGIIRRIVATVDNLPRKKLAPRLLPVRPAAGWLVTDGKGDGVTLSTQNAARYAPYMRVVQAVDPRAAAHLYIRFYPLFQQAYRDLGYPKGNFNDRLVVAIDDLLAAPDLPAPVQLVQPKVFYEFKDPDLEERSAGQKIMMRIGTNNAALVKSRLKAFRSEIAAPRSKP